MDKWLQNNTVVKVVALLLAVMMWMMVNDETNPFGERDGDVSNLVYNVPLKVEYDKDRFDVSGLPQTVTLRVKGPAPSMKRLDESRLEAYVDLKDRGAGVHRNIPIQVKKKGLPGVEVVSRPRTVNVTLKEKQSKVMPVEIEVIGTPAENYHTGEPAVDPGKVRVSGPKEKLDQIRAVKAVMNAQGATETISRSVSLQVYGENGKLDGVQIEPDSVVVKVPITSSSKKVPLRMGKVVFPANGYAVEDLKMNIDQVTVYGPASYLADLKSYPGPRLNLSEAKDDRTFEMSVPLTGKAVKVNPERVTVRVKIVKGKEKMLEDVPIGTRGLKKGGEAEIAGPDRMDLTLFGAPSRLAVDESDVKAYVNLAGLGTGEHQVPVEADLPDYLRLSEKPTVTVRIQK
ncbi:YbbR domain-containing protein [Melghirimyces profundicolus]|uniref:YbbR domain-containing protein n=1 Tax=Melghirimyces profundicolus TaxID=1242148 RepID=A0A2T6BSD3_9BACL|nr:CdaR family protein [Melghirimyces profundicolus]PTX58926.1 YbbR domain-containing protein [Melghirimyces profundicolus]